MTTSLRPLPLVVALLLLLAVARAVSAGVADPQASAPGGAIISGTTHESLCVDGYLPDGTFFDCP